MLIHYWLTSLKQSVKKINAGEEHSIWCNFLSGNLSAEVDILINILLIGFAAKQAS